eukprot:1322222-Prymnesium_polylepis.1
MTHVPCVYTDSSIYKRSDQHARGADRASVTCTACSSCTSDERMRFAAFALAPLGAYLGGGRFFSGAPPVATSCCDSVATPAQAAHATPCARVG